MSEDAGRDSDWFEALFLECGNKVLAYATRRCPGDADDIVAEVFATAWKYRSNVPAEPLPWLYRPLLTRSSTAIAAGRGVQPWRPGPRRWMSPAVIRQTSRTVSLPRSTVRPRSPG